jgi:histone acetyltransferase (RNA polymerase elongator complex component)
MKRHYIIPIFVPHKGCPHDCVFCNQKRITGRTDDIDDKFVEDEIDKYLNTISAEDRFVEVSFFGGSFTGLPVQEQVKLLKPAKSALDSGKIDAIRLSTRPDYISPAILDVLKVYGVSIIELGVQSMDADVLKQSNRGHSIEDVYMSSGLIKDYGFTLGLQMMVGLPGDNEHKDIKTAEEFIKIRPEMVRIYPALVIKDTYMEIMYKRGIYTPLAVDEAVEICSRLYLKFESVGINIIRIGLQPTENIQPGRDVVSGPFHPAFRELVESKILNDIVKYQYSLHNSSIITICINEKSLSRLYADKKKYFNIMLNDIGPARVKVEKDNSLPLNSINVICGEMGHFMSIKDYSLLN